jgi:hypothetical protein
VGTPGKFAKNNQIAVCPRCTVSEIFLQVLLSITKFVIRV